MPEATAPPQLGSPVTTGTVDFDGHHTWYRITGTLDPDAERAPVVILHGGPGTAYNYCLAMTRSTRTRRSTTP